MEISEMKPLLPLDFSLSVKSEGNSSLTNMTASHKADGPMLLSPEKGSSSAFKVVTPKNSDGKLTVISVFFFFSLNEKLFYDSSLSIHGEKMWIYFDSSIYSHSLVKNSLNDFKKI